MTKEPEVHFQGHRFTLGDIQHIDRRYDIHGDLIYALKADNFVWLSRKPPRLDCPPEQFHEYVAKLNALRCAPPEETLQ